MVMLDLQKAFDTVNHQILLSKLKCIGLSDPVKWFHSYRTGRTQVVDVDHKLSEVGNIPCGVSQGSISVFDISGWFNGCCKL